MDVKIWELNCVFCAHPICFLDGDMLNYQSHLEYEHEVMIANQELVLALNFLTQNEVKELINKMKHRKEYFFAHGVRLASEDILDDNEVNVEAAPLVEQQLEQIQQMLNDDFSDSEDESSAKDDDDVIQIEQHQSGKIVEEITIDDSDSEDESFTETKLGNVIETVSNISNIKEEDEFTSNKKEKEPVSAIKRNDEISLKPCNIPTKNLVTQSQSNVSDSVDINEDGDLDSQQQQILENVSCKMEIGENEVDEQDENWVSSTEINRINLVEKFSSLNHCRLCFSSFSDKEKLTKHEETVHKDDQEALNLSFFTLTDLVYHCNMCPQIPGFLTENILNTHKKLQHRLKVRNTVSKCEICHKVVKYYGLKAHMLTHTQEKKHECNLCYKKFLQKSYLQGHQKSIHSEEAEYFNKNLTEFDLNFMCEECNLKFISDSVLKYHQKSHETSEKKFKCKLCYSGFSKIAYLSVHQKIHKEDQDAFDRTLADNDLKFRCTECEQRFLSKNILEYHSQYGHKFTGQERECKLCYKKFTKKRYLLNHHQALHKKDTEFLNRELTESDLKYNCSECEKKFVTNDLLKLHQRKHKSEKYEFLRTEAFDPTENRYRCKLCYTNFKSFSTLVSHTVAIHKNESEFLNRELTASDLKYNCGECGKKFVTKDLVKSHRRKHASEKFEFLRKEAFDKLENIYRCKLCYTNYKSFSSLVSHTIAIHKDDMELLQTKIEENELVHNCSECDYRFVTEPLLDYHNSRSHSLNQETKHCKLCDLEFKAYGGFRQHKYKIHRLELAAFKRNYEEKDFVYECSACDKKFVTETSSNYHMKSKHSMRTKKNIKIKSENQERFCRLCFIIYKEPKYLRIHKQKIHAGEMDAFEKELSAEDMQQMCKKCDKSFYSQNTLEYHMQRKHKKYNGTNEFPCKLCYIAFPFNSVLRKHLKVIHKNDMNLFNGDLDETLLTHCCKICDKRFVADHILKYHMKYQHKEHKDKSAYCKLCYADFKHSSHLKAHKSNVHTSREEIEAFDVKLERSSLQYKCKFCSKRFLTQNILRYHNVYNHKEERRQDTSCEFCNKIFKWTPGRKKVLENHMRNLHNLNDYNVDEQEPVQKENETVKNFMLLLNSL